MVRGKRAAIPFLAAFFLADFKNAFDSDDFAFGAEIVTEASDSTSPYSTTTEARPREQPQDEAPLPDSTLREIPVPDAFQPVDYEDPESLAERLYGRGHGSQKGSGEKYGKLLSKGNDFTHLPETHPARIHADSRALHKRSFHLMLAGIVLATTYLGFYCYQTSGSGLRTHGERHSFALSRMSSPSSTLVLVAAWRLWLGFLVSGLLSLSLNAYRLEKASNRRRRILPKWAVDHWQILVGLPLLALVLMSGRATQMATLESGAAAASAGGLLGKVLAKSGAAYQSFFLDAFFQIPFGLVVVGIGGLLAALVGKLRQAFRKPATKKQLSPSSRHVSSDGDETHRPTSESGFEADSRDRSESWTHGSITHRKKLRKEKSSRRRRRMTLDDLPPEQDDTVRSHSSTSTRRVLKRRTGLSNRRYSLIHSPPQHTDETPEASGDPGN